jgi:TatD DNase family protein
MDRPVFIDTHAHLDDARFANDRDEVVARAKDAGVKTIVTVGCWESARGFGPVADLLRSHPDVYAALGVHPHEAASVVDETPYGLIRDLASGGVGTANGRVVAIGETGLDYRYRKSPPEAQREVFRRHVRLARELNLPLIVHSRDADEETLDILADEGLPEAGGVLHCFTGTIGMARKAVDMGMYLSFTGIVTFPDAGPLREAVKATPVEKMLIETDCPYLAPVPERGKRNEPSFIVHTAKAIAGIKGVSAEDIGRVTTLNAEELFGIDAPQDVKIAYRIRDTLYLNVTNRCTNRCTFCAKFRSYTVKGHYLRLREEPDFDSVMRAIGPDAASCAEVTFCGFGEPLLRLDLVKEVGMRLKKAGCRIRIDTDGLANLVHGRNVLPELAFADGISVSLNAPDSATYQRLVKTPFGDAAYPAILYFLREAKKHIARVTATVVALPGLDMEACRKVAEDDLGVGFRVREYDSVG